VRIVVFTSHTRSGSSGFSHFISPGPTPNDYELPNPSSSTIQPSLMRDEEVSFPDRQMAGASTTPFYSPGPPWRTGGFLAIPGIPGSPHVPRLRPASWGSPSQVDEAFEGHQLTRSRSSADFGGNSNGEEEDLPFCGRTLPPLIIPHDPWRSGPRTTPNVSSTSSRDHSPGSRGLSTTNSLPSTSFPTNYSDEEYR
jgi:hypothetical protein